MDYCTAAETLRDFTGRPVLHLPLDPKLAKELSVIPFTTVEFWQKLQQDVESGDSVVALSVPNPPDGLHPSCVYSIFDIIPSTPGSTRLEDVLIKVRNSYPDGPAFLGAAISDRGAPQPASSAAGRAERHPHQHHQEFLTIPYSVFLRNFSSIQHCMVNCGDRFTIPGEWEEGSSGGSPKYTTFRTNPMYVVQNHGESTVSCVAEIRHMSPVFYDPNNVGMYYPTALAVLRPKDPLAPLSPLFSFSTHEMVIKGVLTDAREVTVEIVFPPNSISYLVPYTKQKKSFGRFQLSLYPNNHPVELSRLRPLAETDHTFSKEVLLIPSGNSVAAAVNKVQVDFAISEPCDCHLLLHQNKESSPEATKHSTRGMGGGGAGDYLASDEVTMTVFQDGFQTKLASSGNASNAREHAICFTANKRGRYTVILTSPSKLYHDNCPCTLTIFIPKEVKLKFIPPKDKKQPYHHHVREVEAALEAHPPAPATVPGAYTPTPPATTHTTTIANSGMRKKTGSKEASGRAQSSPNVTGGSLPSSCPPSGGRGERIHPTPYAPVKPTSGAVEGHYSSATSIPSPPVGKPGSAALQTSSAEVDANQFRQRQYRKHKEADKKR